jgi:hypothetical protein
MVGKRDFGKLRVFRSFIFLLFLFFLFPVMAQAQWEGAVPQRLTFDQFPNRVLALTIDNNDKLYLCYARYALPWVSTDYRIFYSTKEKGGVWIEPVEIGNPLYSVDYGCQPSVTIDPRYGIIHIVYNCEASIPFGPSSKLLYTNSENNWEVELIDSLLPYPEGDRYAGVSIQLDTSSNVHLKWSKRVPRPDYKIWTVVYANNSSGQWARQEVTPPNFFGAAFLAVQGDGVAHILYSSPNDSIYICHARNDTLGGDICTTDSIVYPFYWGNGDAFAVDGNNDLHMALTGTYNFDYETSYVWYYHKENGSNLWEGPEELSLHGGLPGFLIDQGGKVHLIWQLADVFFYHIYFYATKIDSQWQTDTLIGLDLHPDGLIARLDSQGKGHAVFAGMTYPIDESTEIFYYGSTTSVEDTSDEFKIRGFELFQNYPNPFNSSTAIPFTVHSKQQTVNRSIHTTLTIYNILGEEVRTLVDENKREGQYQVIWDGKNDKGKEVSSGVYFYILKCGAFHQVKKLVLIK